MKTKLQKESWGKGDHRKDGEFSKSKNNVLTHDQHKIWNRRKLVKCLMFGAGFILGAGVLASVVLPINMCKSNIKTLKVSNFDTTPYLVTTWYFNQTDPSSDANVMFDLNTFCSEGNPGYGYEKIEFVDTITSGILIGENQSITLGCSDTGEIIPEIPDSNTTSYAVAVGSTTATDGNYVGNLVIDSSFKSTSYTPNVSVYGVKFNNIDASSNVTINGNFVIGCNADGYNVDGVIVNELNGTLTTNGTFFLKNFNTSGANTMHGFLIQKCNPGSVLNGNGLWSITSNSTAYNNAFGAYIYYSEEGSTQNFNGAYTVQSNFISAGVSYSNKVYGNLNVNGTFMITGQSVDGIAFNAGATYSSNAIWNIGGYFTIQVVGSNSTGYFLDFSSSASLVSKLNISSIVNYQYSQSNRCYILHGANLASDATNFTFFSSNKFIYKTLTILDFSDCSLPTYTSQQQVNYYYEPFSNQPNFSPWVNAMPVDDLNYVTKDTAGYDTLNITFEVENLPNTKDTIQQPVEFSFYQYFIYSVSENQDINLANASNMFKKALNYSKNAVNSDGKFIIDGILHTF